jgi:beta-phosphoglucomutase-like phosphatase (HAD superfamily)
MAAVEDSVAGAKSARAAGFTVFGLATADHEHIEPAHMTIRRLHDLPGLVVRPQPVEAR